MPSIADINTWIDNAQTIGVPVAGIVAIVVGAVLWIAGGRMIRPTLGVTGLLLGGVAGWVFGSEYGDPWVLWGAVLGLGIVCCVLAVVLFRVWMSVSFAIFLALAVPVIVVAWQHNAPLPDQPPEQTRAAVAEAVDDLSLDREHVSADRVGDIDLTATMRDAWSYVRDQARARWQSLDPNLRRTLGVTALFGAIAGAVLGLTAPKLSARLISSFNGGCLMLGGVYPVVKHWAPQQMDMLPDTSRGVLAVAGLITALGVIIQWTVSRRPADK